MGPCNVIMGPCNVITGPCNVYMGPPIVNRGTWNMIRVPEMRLWDRAK